MYFQFLFLILLNHFHYNLEHIFRIGSDCCSYKNNNIVGVMDFNKNVILSISIDDDKEAYKSE